MLESIGLALAVIVFAGWTPKLEALLNVFKKKLFCFVMFFISSEHQDVDPLRGFEEKTERMIGLVLVAVIVLGALAFMYYSSVTVPHEPYAPNTIGDVVLLVVGFVLGFVFSCFVSGVLLWLAAVFFMYLVLMPLALIFHLMSIPRRSIVGTLGLLLAAAAFIERFL